ncbi:hypothetical protein [Neptuniibacter halophilus]|uniref:hypothetical protein n=1 Tax=Neptuniibacter halophilus TaxID=651666 RepID=UPI0025734AB2|nr:hypothetical protein [Neptuniibacter halophilus]
MSASLHNYVDRLIGLHADDQGREMAEEIELERKAEQIAETLEASGRVWDGSKWYDDNDVLALMQEAGHIDRFATRYQMAGTDIQRMQISKEYVAQMKITRVELASEIAADVLAAEITAAEGF